MNEAPSPTETEPGSPGDFIAESPSRPVNGFQSWSRNWMPLVVIWMPFLLGAVCVCIAIGRGPRGSEYLSGLGIALQLASAYVAAIWIGLGPSTFVRATIDWAACLLGFNSVILIQISRASDQLEGAIVAVLVLFVVVGIFSLAAFWPFLLFRAELPLCRPGEFAGDHWTIADLFTITGLIALFMGSMRMAMVFAAPNKGPMETGEVSLVQVATFVETLFVYFLIGCFFSVIVGAILGLPLVKWANHCCRKSSLSVLIFTCLIQAAIALGSLYAICIFPNKPFALQPVVAVFAIAILQSFVFLTLVALMFVQFRQGDLVDKYAQGKISVTGDEPC